MKNYNLDELAEMIVDSVLSEQFLNKSTLIPKVRALIRTMVSLKNIPKDYNSYESPTLAAKRLRTIEQKNHEIKFWMNLVRDLDPVNMQKHYKQQHAMLVTKGFKEADTNWQPNK